MTGEEKFSRRWGGRGYKVKRANPDACARRL